MDPCQRMVARVPQGSAGDFVGHEEVWSEAHMLSQYWEYKVEA
jgi:hypothetical protein